MKKLTKISIEELKKQLPVLDRNAEQCIYGGYDENDCWWRCMAYIKSGGSNYSQDDAYALACAYYGSNFDGDNYVFTGNRSDFNDYVSGYITCSDCGDFANSKVLVFDPSQISNWEGNGNYHAVIITGYSDGDWITFDPQTGTRGTISAMELNDSSGSFFVDVK